MKLDATDVRYITPEEYRVLTAVEMGSKNHEVVPTTLIAQISSLRHAGISKLLSNLLKRRLVARVQNNVYDGFRLTYGGYDYLAVRALSKRKSMYAVGNQIGVGKESDIYLVSDEEGECRVLKIHRLGRISFRKIKEKRDYMGKRKSASWMYMSRLAAQKEYAFMQVRWRFRSLSRYIMFYRNANKKDPTCAWVSSPHAIRPDSTYRANELRRRIPLTADCRTPD